MINVLQNARGVCSLYIERSPPGSHGLPLREGMRRPPGGDGEGTPSPYKGRGDGIGCSLSLEMKTQDRPLSCPLSCVLERWMKR